MLVRTRSRAPAGALLEPPRVRAWRGRVRSPWAVVTLATGEHGRALLDVSGPLMRRYARKIGADFRVIRGEAGSYPCARKWEVSAYLRRYERVVWLDADALVAPDCPNLLELVPRGMIGVHNELPLLPDPDWVWSGMLRICESQGWERSESLPRAWNSGVFVADREHAEVFSPPARPFPDEWCAEQWHEQLMAERLGVSVFELPPAFNRQWWVRRVDMVEPESGVFIYHYSGLFGKPEERLRQMRAMARRLEVRGA